MKKIIGILVLTLYFNLYSYSQNNNVNVNNVEVRTTGITPAELANNAKKEQGTVYLGNGDFKVTKVGGSGFVSLKKLQKRATDQIIAYCISNSLNHKILNVEKFKSTIGVFPKVIVTYKLFTKEGLPVLTDEEQEEDKDLIIKRLHELKKLKDEQIITEEEYEVETKKLKSKLFKSN